MTTLERALQSDLDRLVDRLAAVTREGMSLECAECGPTLRARLESAEARLSAIRLDLLRGFGDWYRALEECGDLWATAALAADQPSGSDLRAA